MALLSYAEVKTVRNKTRVGSIYCAFESVFIQYFLTRRAFYYPAVCWCVCVYIVRQMSESVCGTLRSYSSGEMTVSMALRRGGHGEYVEISIWLFLAHQVCNKRNNTIKEQDRRASLVGRASTGNIAPANFVLIWVAYRFRLYLL